MEDKKASEESYSLVKIENKTFPKERYSFGGYEWRGKQCSYSKPSNNLECPKPNYELDWKVKDHKNDLFYDLCVILFFCMFSYVLDFVWDQIKSPKIVENPITNEEITHSSSVEMNYLGRK